MRIIFLISQIFISLTVFSGEEDNYSKVLNPKFRLNGIEVQNAFGSAKDIALTSTVRLIRNNKLIALGCMVDPRGYLITKASSCVGARTAKTADGKEYSLKIKTRNEELDLVLYQIISENTSHSYVKWDMDNNISEGSWVLSANASLDEIRIGVFSANKREIGREGGVMGVLFTDNKNSNFGVKIEEVIPHSAAYKAGMLKGDIVTYADDRKIKSKEALLKIIGNKDPGDAVKIRFHRKEIIRDILVTLGHRSVTFDLFNRNLQMSGPISKRKDNFSEILQHDIPLPREAMGGGLFNLYGKCIGINIARVDRVTIYTIPAHLVQRFVKSYLEKIDRLTN